MGENVYRKETVDEHCTNTCTRALQQKSPFCKLCCRVERNDERIKYPKRKLQPFEKLKNASLLVARFHVGCVEEKLMKHLPNSETPKIKKNVCKSE